MMTSIPVVRIGILGVSSIGNRSVIPAILSLSERYDLKGIASRDITKAEITAKTFGGKAFGSYETLLKDPDIDAVYIPLPNALHFEYVMMALEYSKHVLVEKSMGCTLAEVQEMVKKAKENGLVLLENFQFRFHSQMEAILNYVKSGIIGDLRCVRVAFGFPPFKDSENIRYRSELGGGALLDAGAYAMKITPYFLGNDLLVSQASMAFDKQRNVDIWGGGVIEQKNGPLFSQFAYGFDQHYQCSLELWGSNGKLNTNRIFTAPVNFKPQIIIETPRRTFEEIIEPDDSFANILIYFHEIIGGRNNADLEYEQNILQAALINSFKSNANK